VCLDELIVSEDKQIVLVCDFSRFFPSKHNLFYGHKKRGRARILED